MKLSFYRTAAGLLAVAAASLTVSAQVSNFDTLNGYASGLETRVAQGRNSILRLGTADEQSSNLTGTASYLDRKVDATGDSIERSTSGEGALVGYNWKKGDWNFGASLGADDTKTDYNEVNSPAPVPLHGSVKASTVEGSAWAGVAMGSVRLAFFGSLGSTTNKGTRISDTGSSHADYDSRDSSLGVQISYTSPLGESALLQPFVGLSTATADSDGFTELGTAPDRRILQGFSVRESRAAVGVRVTGKSGPWIPSATVAWLDRFSGGATTISNTAINGSNLGAGVSPAASTGLFYVQGEVNGTLSEHWLAGISASYFTGGAEKQFLLSLSVHRTF